MSTVITGTDITVDNVVANTGVDSPSVAVDGSEVSAFGFKNKIINGDMRVNQRGSGTYQLAYAVDRWLTTFVDDGVAHQPFNSTINLDYGWLGTKHHFAKYTSSDNTANRFTTLQRIESKNTVGLQDKTVTLSFKLAYDGTISGTPDVDVVITSANNYDDFSATTTMYSHIFGNLTTLVDTTKKFVKFEYTFIANGNTHRGLEIDINVKTLDDTPFTDATTVIALTEVQLEEGSVATPFEQRPIGLELSLCQRYYQSTATDNNGSFATITGAVEFYMPGVTRAHSATLGQTILYKVEMRANPSVTMYSTDGTSGNMWTASGNKGVSLVSLTTFSFKPTNNSGAEMAADLQCRLHYELDAEL